MEILNPYNNKKVKIISQDGLELLSQYGYETKNNNKRQGLLYGEKIKLYKNNKKIDSAILNKKYKLSSELNFKSKKDINESIKKNIKKIENINFKDKKILENWFELIDLNKLTNYFTFYQRMRCKMNKRSNKRPLDYYLKNSSLYEDEPRKQFKLLKKKYNFEICSNFNISRVISILKYFFGDDLKNIKYLDPSAGWGDRLIGALLSNIKQYTGIDPNINLKIYYNDIIKKINSKTNVKIYNTFFENPDLNLDNDYDIVFTSPPFFDVEIYDLNSEGQSLKNYSSEDKWIKYFLSYYFFKSWNCLKVNGILSYYLELNLNVNNLILKYLSGYKSKKLELCYNDLSKCRIVNYSKKLDYEKRKIVKFDRTEIINLYKYTIYLDKLFNEYWNNYLVNITSKKNIVELLENEKNYFTENKENLSYFIYKLPNEKAVGISKIITIQNINDFNEFKILNKLVKGKAIYTFNTYISEKVRGKGINRDFKSNIFEMYKEKGYKYVIGDVALDNIASFKSIEKIGFKRTNIISKNNAEFVIKKL